MNELDKAIQDYQSSFIDNPYVTQQKGAKTYSFYGPGGHEGTDYRARKGSNLYGMKGWQVVFAGQGESYYGNKVVIKNPKTGEMLEFAHLNDVNVKKGDTIPNEKFIIGHTGNSGRVPNGQVQQEHLHVNYYDSSGKRADVTKIANGKPSVASTAQPNGFPVPSFNALANKIVKPAFASDGNVELNGQYGLNGQNKPSNAYNKDSNLQLDGQYSLRNENKPQNPNQPVMEEYLVKAGDSLSKIANQYGTTWQELANINPNISNPNLIYTGNKINIPKTTPPSSQKAYNGNAYLVKAGDTLSQLSRKLNTTVGSLMAKNNIKDPNKIYSGTTLKY